MVILSIFTSVEPICSLFLLIDSVIYGTFAKLFTIYIYLARMRIFSQDVVKEFTDRVYILVGVAVLFILAYTLLKAIVDPEKNLKGNGLKIVINVITSVAMLALIPTAFNILYDTVDIIVVDNIVGKLFLGNDIGADESVGFEYQELDTSTTGTVETTGSELNTELLSINGRDTGWQVLKAFLYPKNDNPDDIIIDNNVWKTSDTVKTVVITSGIGMVAALVVGTVLAVPTGGVSFAAVMTAIASVSGGTLLAGALAGAAMGGITSLEASLSNYIIAEKVTYTEFELGTIVYGEFDRITSMASNIKDGEITYIPIVSTICGAVLLYFIICFCIELGVRAARLAFYEILAPIPILLRIIPGKEKVFNTWLSAVLKNFFSVVIRIVTLFAVVTLISKIPSFNFSSSSFNFLAKAIVIMGLVIFAKEIPKVIGEITGIDTKGLGMGSNLRELLKAGGAFAAGGALTGFVTSGFNPLGAVRGASYAHSSGTVGGMFHVASNERAHQRQVKKAKAQGSTWMMRRMDGVRGFFGMESLADAADRKIESTDYTVKDRYFDKNAGKMVEQDVKMDSARTRKTEQDKATAEYDISAYNATIRDYKKSQAAADKIKSYRSAIKTEAESKISADDSTLTTAISYKDKDGNAHTINGNYSSLKTQVENLVKDGVITGDEVNNVTQSLGQKQKELRNKYVDNVIAGNDSNALILGNYNQMRDSMSYVTSKLKVDSTGQVIRDANGNPELESYDSSAVMRLNGWEFVDGAFKDCGDISQKFGDEIAHTENLITARQNDVDRYASLLDQVDKQKAKAKKDSTYLAYQATKNIPKNENGTGYPGSKNSGK